MRHIRQRRVEKSEQIRSWMRARRRSGRKMQGCTFRRERASVFGLLFPPSQNIQAPIPAVGLAPRRLKGIKSQLEFHKVLKLYSVVKNPS